jgi:hypothetical protein
VYVVALQELIAESLQHLGAATGIPLRGQRLQLCLVLDPLGLDRLPSPLEPRLPLFGRAPLPRKSRISSSSSFNANTSSSSAGGTCLTASAGPEGAIPSSFRRYSIREIG